MAKKRAFVRYSKQGKIVPGSLILTAGSHPNGPSTWKEVPADLCCDLCKIYVMQTLDDDVSITYVDCKGTEQTTDIIPNQGSVFTVCAISVTPSPANYTISGPYSCSE